MLTSMNRNGSDILDADMRTHSVKIEVYGYSVQSMKDDCWHREHGNASSITASGMLIFEQNDEYYRICAPFCIRLGGMSWRDCDAYIQ